MKGSLISETIDSVYPILSNWCSKMRLLVRGQRSLPIILKSITEKFLLDLLNFEKVWFWDSHGFMRIIMYNFHHIWVLLGLL